MLCRQSQGRRRGKATLGRILSWGCWRFSCFVFAGEDLGVLELPMQSNHKFAEKFLPKAFVYFIPLHTDAEDQAPQRPFLPFL